VEDLYAAFGDSSCISFSDTAWKNRQTNGREDRTPSPTTAIGVGKYGPHGLTVSQATEANRQTNTHSGLQHHTADTAGRCQLVTETSSTSNVRTEFGGILHHIIKD